MFDVLVSTWLISMLSFILFNIIAAFSELARSKVNKRTSSDFISKGGRMTRFPKPALIISAIYFLPVVLSGLSLGTLVAITFWEQQAKMGVIAGLVFGGGGAAATFYSAPYYINSIFRVAQWVINKKCREENKISAIESTVFIGTVIGVIIMLLLLAAGAYESTLIGMLLCVYTPILSTLVTVGFIGPAILIVLAYSGEWKDGKWVKKQTRHDHPKP